MNDLYSTSANITVHTHTPYISVGTAPLAGQVYYDSGVQCLRVYTGTQWVDIKTKHTIGLSGTAEAAIEWATRKMREEQEIEALLQAHPGLLDLKEKFDVMLALVKDHTANSDGK